MITRTCVHPDYRGITTINHLWESIAAVVIAKTQTDLISRVPNNLLYYLHNFSLTYLPYAKI